MNDWLSKTRIKRTVLIFSMIKWTYIGMTEFLKQDSGGYK